MKIARVIPNIRMPRRSKFFDYCVSSALEPTVRVGSVVQIPWRNSLVTGIVYELSNKSEFKNLKNITKVHSLTLPTWQVKLIPWFADYYGVGWSAALHTFLPEPLKNKTQLKPYKPEEVLKLDHKFSKTTINFNNNNLIFLDNNQARLDHLYSSVIQAIDKNKPMLIIFPTIDELSQFYFSLDENLQNQIDVFTNQLNKSQTWDIWQRANQNNFKVILSTRLGIFLPVNNINIIVDQIERLEYKQTDMNPRYHLVDIIKSRLDNNDHCIYQALSLSPKVYIYTSFKKLKFAIINNKIIANKIRFIKHNTNEAKLEFINNLADSASNLFIFLNRKGQFNSLNCNKCNWSPKCPIDNNLLKQHQGVLKCHDCGHSESEPFKCPKCSNKDLAGFGIGTKNIELLLKKANFQITRLDKDIDNDDNLKNLNINWSEKNIVIGTEYALTKLDLSKFLHLIFFNADTDLVFTDYMSSERTLNLYQRIIRQTNINTEIIINTSDPEHVFWQDLASDNNKNIKKELDSRKKFSYPPFSKLTKLIYTNTNEKKVQQITKRMYDKLKQQNLADFIISPPAQNKPYREHKKYYMYILVKAQKIDLEAILSQLDDKWLVDRDPQKL